MPLGGKFIASGSFGCVFHPPLPCKENNIKYVDKSNIGKVFAYHTELQNEKRINNIVEKIDPKHLFTRKLLGVCNIDDTKITGDVDIDSCKHYKKGSQQLIFEDGGNDLTSIDDDQFTRLQFLCMLMPIMRGIIKMQNKGYVHFDIKPLNMLIDERIVLIDFGSAVKHDRILSKDYEILEYPYRYYPIELRYMSLRQRNKRVDEADMLDFFKNNFKRSEINNYFDPNDIEKKFHRFFSKMSKLNNREIVDLYESKLCKLFDSYSFALSVLEMFGRVKMERCPKSDACILILQQMCDINPFERISASVGYSKLKEKMKFYNKKG